MFARWCQVGSWTRRDFLRLVALMSSLLGGSVLTTCSAKGESAQPTAGTAAEVDAAPTPARVAASEPTAAPTVVTEPVIALPSRVSPGPVAKPMYQIDGQHTGRSPFIGPRRLHLLRTFDTGRPDLQPADPQFRNADIQSSAAVDAEGDIYIGLHSGTLFVLRDPGAGDELELQWLFHPVGGSSWHATPALSPDGVVYLGFSTGSSTPEARGVFYALAAPSTGRVGDVLWSADLGPGRQTCSPTLGPDGTIYAVSGAGRLTALAPDGQVRWTAETGPALKASPALSPDGMTIYLASMDGKLYAVAPPVSSGERRGVIRWTFDFGAHLGPTPLVATEGGAGGANGIGSGASPSVDPNGTVYIGANNSNLYAIAPNGTLAWLFEAERERAGVWTAPALSADGTALYFGANKGGIYALNRADGSLHWRFDIYGSVYSSPALDPEGMLYTGSTGGHIYVLDTVSGRPIADYDAGQPIWTAPTIRPDGSLLVADRTGRVLLLGAS